MGHNGAQPSQTFLNSDLAGTDFGLTLDGTVVLLLQRPDIDHCDRGCRCAGRGEVR